MIKTRSEEGKKLFVICGSLKNRAHGLVTSASPATITTSDMTIIIIYKVIV